MPNTIAEVAKIEVDLSRDRVYEAWSLYEADVSRIPPPSLFARCRQEGASDELLERLVHRLADERKLRGYGQGGGEAFLGLVRLYTIRSDWKGDE